MQGRHPGAAVLWLHLLVPVAVLGALLAWAVGGGDQLLADRIYAWGGHGWPLRRAWLTDTVIHVHGRNLNAAAWLVLAMAWSGAMASRAWRPWRRPLGYLLLATLLSCLVVAWTKSWTNMDCPWDLARYGGQRQFVGLFELRPLGMSRGRCFPSGHASAGYAWLALYFFLMAVAPRWRWIGLAAGIAGGLVFGISQQLRGAHFLSHDIVTAGVCWSIALGLYATMLWPGQPAVQDAAAGDAR
ncbi:hypothetical protein CSC64_11565 [Pseudoxanthomonas koreensis]|nr:hypothetical protein CSC64_11565 [Pseudoxanthomonas koreensis]